MERETLDRKQKDRFSTEKIEKVQAFMKFCQSNIPHDAFVKSEIIRVYCAERRLGQYYLTCLVSMGWIEKRGNNKGSVYRWKVGAKEIQPIDARRVISCVNEVIDTINADSPSKPSVSNTPSTGTVVIQETVKPAVKQEPVVVAPIQRKRTPKVKAKQTVETVEVTYLWGLFRRTIKKEIL